VKIRRRLLEQFADSLSRVIATQFVWAKDNAIVSFLAAFENYGQKGLLIVAFTDLRPGSAISALRSAERQINFMPARASLARFFGRFFLRRLGLTRRRAFRRFLGRGGFLSARRGGRRFLFGCFFVGFASIICGIESRPLEDQTCAGAEEALHFAVSPLRQPAELFWAFAKWFVTHRLECVEVLAALLTRIFVSWHQEYGSARSADNAGNCALNDVLFNPTQIMN
jgi:hypothetical protein